ncbi:hypothetical protein ACLK1S_09005 [Escherichia coli]
MKRRAGPSDDHQHCLRFAFDLVAEQAKGNIKSWKATPMQLVNGDEVLTLKFDCRPCEMHVIGKIKITY